MTSGSPPKPWEKFDGSQFSTAAPLPPASHTHPAAATPGAPFTSSDAPILPSRPASLAVPPTANNAVNSMSYPSSLNSSLGSRLGSSPYSGYSGYGNYSSPYSRMNGGMYGGGLGGYNSMVGGYGNGMYGGMAGAPNGGGVGGVGAGGGGDPNSLTQSFNQNTAATFQMIESIVGALGGFAQMLESTYLATHSSFFAMVSVAEQFGNLRDTLGQVLGIFAIVRWLRTAFAKLTGRPIPADAVQLSPSAFSAFLNDKPDSSTPSRKPFVFFMAIVLGLPYIMRKLIQSLASKRRSQHGLVDANPNEIPHHQHYPLKLDPSKLDFCRALYDYTPPISLSTAGLDLCVKKGDLVAVLNRTDPTGAPSDWWRCRARDGNIGYLPGPYLETIQRKPRHMRARAQSQSQSQMPPANTRQEAHGREHAAVVDEKHER